MLTLPVSVLLWLGWLTALLMAMAVRTAWRPLSTFWQAPPEPLRHSYLGAYYGQPRKPQQLSLVDRDAA